MSIKDWGPVKKIQRGLEKTVLVLGNICWNFEKKIGKTFRKTQKFWIPLRKFLRNLSKLWIKFE